MSVTIGLIIGFIGVLLLIAPLAIQLHVRSKQVTPSTKRSLETASILIGIGVVLAIGGILLAAYLPGESVAKYGAQATRFAEENPELFA